MRKFEKNTARESLPSASQLPIIVPMKIWFRTEDEQGGEQSPRQHRSVNPTSPKSPRSPQCPVSSDTSPTKDPAKDFPRRGAARCARFSAADQHHPLAPARPLPALAPPAPSRPQPTASHLLTGLRQGTALAVPNSAQTSGVSTPEARGLNSPTIYQTGSSHSPLDICHCSNISNRFWPANRSCRKQTNKPCLTGARTAQCRTRFSIAGFHSHNRRPLATSHLLALITLTKERTQEGRLATVISNRELLVLETSQLIENKHRRPVLIETLEPNSAPVFRAFVAPAFRRAAFPLTDIPRNHFNAEGAV